MRREDKFESMAREICQESGLDPDERIELLPARYAADGSRRTRPRWTDYRAAAADRHRQKQMIDDGKRLAAMRAVAGMKMKVVGPHEYDTIMQMRDCMAYGDVVGAAICGDGHVAYSQPVGGVVAYRNQVSVTGVGPDIACGNAAIRLDARLSDFGADALPRLADRLNDAISFGTARKMTLPGFVPSLVDDEEGLAALDLGIHNIKGARKSASAVKSLAGQQFGTIGGGNHYLDVFHDDDGFIWIGVHFGSRGVGSHVFNRFMSAAKAKDGRDAKPVLLDIDSDLGERYFRAMTMAGRFAWEGRDYALEIARRVIGGTVTHKVHNFHNFCWAEEHGGERVYVTRKGATPCFPGQEGFVGGSMGDDAVIIAGKEHADNGAMFCSTVHGAGRVMSRRDAVESFRRDDMDTWLRGRGISLRGGTVDESPMAYRRLTDVLALHETTTEIRHVLHPAIVLMAGETDVDPYKD